MLRNNSSPSVRKSYAIIIALLVLFLSVGVAFFFWSKRASSPSMTTSSPNKEQLLTTTYRDKSVYEKAFAETSKPREFAVPPLAMITSHHLLAAPLIARSYAAVADPRIKRIILVSPDHYQTAFGESERTWTTESSWDGLFGNISSDATLIQRLAKETRGVREQRKPFLHEHGIYTEIPFIAHYFPQATIVPLILRNNYDYEDFQALGVEVQGLTKDQVPTLLVVSSDFSHDVTRAVARTQDKQGIEMLSHIDTTNFDNLRNDCRSCIAFLAGYLHASGTAPIFTLMENKDALDFGSTDLDNVTSYVNGYYATSQPPFVSPDKNKKNVSILFGGDMQFDRYIRTVMREKGQDFVLANLQETLHTSDLIVANLEGPITDNPSESETSVAGEAKNYVFTFPPETAAFLAHEHIGPVNIGNNHILNFKADGVEQTKKYLHNAGVNYFGSPLAGDNRTDIEEVKGTRIAFVNYNQFVSDGEKKTLEDLKNVQGKVDFTVVFTHWGIEYTNAPAYVKTLAHEFIDAGADLIIGTHPHVVQETEIYKGKKIYYSLGNFIFDQYFRPETQKGLLVRATFDPASKEITTQDIPITLKNSGQTILDQRERLR